MTEDKIIEKQKQIMRKCAIATAQAYENINVFANIRGTREMVASVNSMYIQVNKELYFGGKRNE